MATERDRLETEYVVKDRGTPVLAKIGRSISAIGAVTAGIAGAAGAFGAVKGIIAATTAMETYQARLQTTLGSQQKVNAAMGFLSDFARRTPFELKEVVDAFVRMQAYGLDPTPEKLRKIGDFAASMGRSFTDAVEAIADASRGEFERIREFGLTKEAVARFGKNLIDAKGQITDYAAFQQSLFKAMEARSGGAMERLSTTILGKWSNLKDTLFRTFAAIGEGIRVPLGNAIVIVTRLIEKLASPAVLKRISDFFASAFSVRNMQNFATTLVRLGLYFGEFVTQVKNQAAILIESLRAMKDTAMAIWNYMAALRAGGNATQRGRDLFGIAKGDWESARIQGQYSIDLAKKEALRRNAAFANIPGQAKDIIDKSGLFKGLSDKPAKFPDTKPADFGNMASPVVKPIKAAMDKMTEAILGGGELARVGIKATQLGGQVIGAKNAPIQVKVDAGPNAPLNKAIEGMFSTFLVSAIKQGKVAVPGH